MSPLIESIVHPDIHLLTFIAGALSYVVYFFHGEHHMFAFAYIQAHTVLFATSTLLLYRLEFPLVEALLQTLVYDGFFLAGLFGSLLVYRAFLNPLNAFPGPFITRIATFWISFRIKRLRMYKAFEELHEEYGYFVRVGSQEISITHQNAVVDIFGADSVCQKSAWYDISNPQDSVLLRRTFAKHSERRAIWTKAFSVKAIRGYEARFHIPPVQGQDAFQTRPTRRATCKYNPLAGFVFLGLHERPIIRPFVRLARFQGPSLGNEGPRQGDEHHRPSFANAKTEPNVADVMSTLFVPYKKGVLPFDETAVQLLAGESHLLVNTRGDTSRITMICTLFVLAQKPELANRLRKALEPHVPENPDEMLMDDKIMNIDLLNGIVQEALRLYPPSPSHPTRVIPPEGTMIAGRFIPGNTQAIAPQLPELVKDKKAMAPFSLGPMNGVGKRLALANIRVTVASFVMRYNLSFPRTQADPEGVFENGLYEHFSLQSGPLMLCLEKRH